jgi:hypothetical protein
LEESPTSQHAELPTDRMLEGDLQKIGSVFDDRVLVSGRIAAITPPLVGDSEPMVKAFYLQDASP